MVARGRRGPPRHRCRGESGRAARAPRCASTNRLASTLALVVLVAAAFVGLARNVDAQTNHSPAPPPPFDPASGWPSSGVRTLDVPLPPAETVEDEEYLCTSVPLPKDRPMQLTRVEPLASAAVVHHILLYGCSEANTEPVWRCRGHSVCSPSATTQHILYGWAKDAPPAGVPEGAAFRVGHGTGTPFLVMQVHFSKQRPAGDTSGVRLHLGSGAGGSVAPFSAGLTMFARYFQIPPREPEVRVPNQCCLRGFEPQHAFAFRVHAHDMGRSNYLERSPRHPGSPTTVVAQRDPQLPQGFTPIAQELTIWPGDRLTMTCLYDASNSDRIVYAGQTHNDEMCNMYIMQWAELGGFYTCGGGSIAASDPHGPGGLPGGADAAKEGKPGAVVREDASVWPEATAGVKGGVDDDGTSIPAPSPETIGQVTSVARAGDGTVWVLRRGSRPWVGSSFSGNDGSHFNHADAISDDDALLMRVDQDTGEVVQRCGRGLFWMPHMVSPTRDGKVWVSDAGSHTVSLLDRECKVVRVLGTRGSPGKGDKQFCKPTRAIEIGDGGDVLVSDGYCNARVARFDASGIYQGEYDLEAHEAKFPAPGKKAVSGESSAAIPMETVRPHVAHDVAVDECLGQMYVADREHGAVRRFDLTTKEPTGLWDVSRYGYVYAVSVGPYGKPMALTWRRDSDQKSFALQLRDEPPGSGQRPPPGVFSEFKFVHFSSDDGVDGGVEAAWELPGSEAPHDWALIAGPPRLADAERPLALLVAEARPDGRGALNKYIFLRGTSEERLPPVPSAATPVVSARELWKRMRASAAKMAASAAGEVAAADAAASASGVKHHHGGGGGAGGRGHEGHGAAAHAAAAASASSTSAASAAANDAAHVAHAVQAAAAAEHAKEQPHTPFVHPSVAAKEAEAAMAAAARAKVVEALPSSSSTNVSPLLRAKWLGETVSSAASAAAGRAAAAGSYAAGRASSAAKSASEVPHAAKGAAVLMFAGCVGAVFVGARAAASALKSGGTGGARKRNGGKYQCVERAAAGAASSSTSNNPSGVVNASKFAP